jgi:hypothetical protein
MEQEAKNNNSEKNEADIDSEYYECYVRDANEILKNPKYVGINFDISMMIDARYCLSNDYIKIMYPTITDDQRETARINEDAKVNNFKSYVGVLSGKLNHARVHSYGPLSPLASKWANLNGEARISSKYLEQLNYLRDRCPDVTVVVPFYDETNPGSNPANVPLGEVATSRYIGTCKRLAEEVGEDIIIEVGNETNVCNKTSENFEIDSFGDHVDPIEYANFFIKTAQILKNEHPSLRLSIAGTACFDINYAKTVLAEIEKSERASGQKLVDVISYHPYGSNAESAYSIENGKFIKNDINFQEQYDAMQKIATEHAVNLTIGEINYPKSARQSEELSKFLEKASEIGVESCIWPSISMHKEK